MSYTFTPIVTPLIAGAVILLLLGFYSLKYLSKPSAIPFLLVIIAFLEWTVCYTFELSALTLPLTLLWANLQFIGIGAAPIFWLMTSLKLTGHQRYPAHALLIIAILPLITVILAFTNSSHHLFRVDPILIESGRTLLLEANYGIWHKWIFMPYQYLLYGASILVLLYAYEHAKRPYKRQYLALVAAALIPLIGSVLYIIAVPPFENLNPTPFLFVISSLVFGKAIFSYRILDITPIARDTVVENLKDAVLVFDSSHRLIDYNPAAVALFPTLRPESIGIASSELFTDEDTLSRQISSDLGENEIDLTIQQESSGEQKHYRSSLSILTCVKGDRIGKIITISDITAQVNLLRKMEWLATTDELTELNNRRSFFQRATMEMERARRYDRPISFILLDLDHFKRINDSYGHAAGDLVLTETARRIRRSIRDTDIAGRYGGEEFAVCLPETRQHTAENLAERLRAIIADSPIEYGDKELSITASFGIIGRDKIDEETVENLFAKADKALYMAKEKGRNLCVPFSY